MPCKHKRAFKRCFPCCLCRARACACVYTFAIIFASAFAFLCLPARAGENATEENFQPPPLTLKEADDRLAVAHRMLQGGVFDRALELAESVLNDPAAAARTGDAENIQQWRQRRENARFIQDLGRFGLATDIQEIEEIADSFVQLVNNRYRLQDPAYHIQAAYWAARAFETAGDYRQAVDYYSRVGGITLPPEMEGDAAQRMSRCLRLLANEIPYPGNLTDRQRRDQLLNQAITELDRARLSFPVGNRRKEIELDRIALRLARREEQFVREAATEAGAYIESDPARDELRARAVLYRGQAAAMLGQPNEAVDWFNKVIHDEAPNQEVRGEAYLGLALALTEIAESSDERERIRLLQQADAALDHAVSAPVPPDPKGGALILKAKIQIELGLPSAALDTLKPILELDRINPAAWHFAGQAELRRGRLGEALNYLYPPTRPSNPIQRLRFDACHDASRTADARRNFGLALALNHKAAKIVRENRLFSSLMAQQSNAMDIILKLGKMSGPVSLSSDNDLLTAGTGVSFGSLEERRNDAAGDLALALSQVLWHGGDPDAGHDLGVAAEAVYEWSGDGIPQLELAISMISHLRRRRPADVTDNVLSSHMGDARHALAQARADQILRSIQPDRGSIDRTLGDFAAAAASFQEASSSGSSLQDNLNQGMVNLESGAFLMRLSEKWEHGQWAADAMTWREEARQRIEASLRPFNQAIANSPPSNLAARRARWSRGSALELMGEWRGAANDFLALLNNSELPRILRANAARRWAVCMGKLGENATALTRLGSFADIDAESALLAGTLAEEAGYSREAYQQYLFAANPDSPSFPPITPGRIQNAACLAGRLALNDPNEANPFLPPEQVKSEARTLLERNAILDPDSEWSVSMLSLIGESWLREPGGAVRALEFARSMQNRFDAKYTITRAMHILAARALQRTGDFTTALDELDAAREILADDPASRKDAALITLETARTYRQQNRNDDALRAFADVFAIYPDEVEAAEDARLEAAIMLLTEDGAGQREREQARSVLSGLRDQVTAEKTMRDYGIR